MVALVTECEAYRANLDYKKIEGQKAGAKIQPSVICTLMIILAAKSTGAHLRRSGGDIISCAGRQAGLRAAVVDSTATFEWRVGLCCRWGISLTLRTPCYTNYPCKLSGHWSLPSTLVTATLSGLGCFISSAFGHR